MSVKSILDWLLSDDAKNVALNLQKSSVKGVHVVGRGTVVADGKEIASSDEFMALKKAAAKIVEAESTNSRQVSES